MKVKVNFKPKATIMTQGHYNALMEEMERLIQENKDLRVREGHLKDDVKRLSVSLNASQVGQAKLADMVIEANERANKAEHEAAAINLELMDREERISLLENKVEWQRNIIASMDEAAREAEAKAHS